MSHSGRTSDCSPSEGRVRLDLRRLLEIEDQAHDAATMISGPRAEQAVQWARRLDDLAVRAG